MFFTTVGILSVIGLSNVIDRISGYNFPLFGFRNSVIVSDSMSYSNAENTYLDTETYNIGRIQVYDVVTTKVYKTYDDIQLYDVITYKYGNTLVCHRVIDKYIDNETNNKCLITRGDANNISDLEPVTWDKVRGKVINVSRGTGKTILFFQSPYFLIAISGSLFFVLLGMYIYDYHHDKNDTNGGEPKDKHIQKPKANN